MGRLGMTAYGMTLVNCLLMKFVALILSGLVQNTGVSDG